MTRRRTLPFVKLHGAANDYVLVDAIEDPSRLALAPDLARPISDRHLGVGSDGLIVMARSERADIRMHMWNSDGSRGAMCGNGLRCVAKLAHDTGAIRGAELTIESDSGVHATTLRLDPHGDVVAARTTIGGVVLERQRVPLTVAGATWNVLPGFVGKGPHAVVYVDTDPEDHDLERIGGAFQTHPRFPDGVNVEFVRARPPDTVEQRTYERGAGETMACGSGATAAAAAAMALGLLRGPQVRVELRGGTLLVERLGDGSFALEGPVRTAFRGEFALSP